MSRTPEEYRQHPIYGTDFSKPLTVIIEELRSQLMHTRGQVNDIEFGYPQWKDRLENIEGLLSCGIINLHHINEEIRKWQIECDDQDHGPSLKFSPRGIGSDFVPCCFVCETPCHSYMANIAAFVKSREEGETIVGWFGTRARLDYRPSEPGWIQVKVGACDKHVPNLESLGKATAVHGVIRASMIAEAMNAAALI